MGPNDWSGDQCDMTGVGGFSRKGMVQDMWRSGGAMGITEER